MSRLFIERASRNGALGEITSKKRRSLLCPRQEKNLGRAYIPAIIAVRRFTLMMTLIRCRHAPVVIGQNIRRRFTKVDPDKIPDLKAFYYLSVFFYASKRLMTKGGHAYISSDSNWGNAFGL